MQAAGYTKDGDGFWAKDGAADVGSPNAGLAETDRPGHREAVARQRLRRNVQALRSGYAPFFDMVRAGNASAWIIVHCGSSREPHGTLQHFHSRFASPAQGQQNSYIWANSQYQNPDYDAIINQMDAIQPSPTDAHYVELAGQATNIFLRDVVEITLAEERHVVTFNNTYWTGWMNTSNPYAAPYSLWAPFLLSFLKVQPGPGASYRPHPA